MKVFYIFIYFILLYVFIIRNYKNHKTLFIPSILFSISYFIVFFQIPLDYFIGNIQISDGIFISENYLEEGLQIATIGFLFFIFGHSTKKNISNRASKLIFSVKVKRMFTLLFILFFLLYLFTTNPLYFIGGNGIIDPGIISSYSSEVFIALLFSYIFYINLCFREISLRKVYSLFGLTNLIFLFFFLLLNILSGDRGILASILLSFLFIIRYRFKFFKTTIFVVLAFFIFSLLGKIRTYSNEITFFNKVALAISEGEYNSRFERKSFSPYTLNLANSYETFTKTLEITPEIENYRYGYFQIRQLITAIPFSSSVFEYFFPVDHWRYGVSAYLISYHLTPYRTNQTGNKGTNILSDFYFDFGIVSLVIGMFFCGYIFKISDFLYLKPNVINISFIKVFAFIIYLNSFYIPRGAFLQNIKISLYVFIIVSSFKILSSKKQKLQ